MLAAADRRYRKQAKRSKAQVSPASVATQAEPV